MSSSKQKKYKKSTVFPEDSFDEKGDNLKEGQELDSYDEDDMKNTKNKKASNKFKMIAKKSVKNSPLNLIANVKSKASQWKKYVTSKRKTTSNGGSQGVDRRKTGGMGLTAELPQDELDGARLSTQRQMVVAHNRNLIEYFARLGRYDSEENVNLDYVQSLLTSGAKIDCTDKYGQTVMHEVARAWHIDVARFFIENGANVNQIDNYGRTPLHVAAAVDYPEMVNFLIQAGANKEARTRGEHQTPLFYAARNDACNSLKALIKANCEYKVVKDYKGRTPLHVAAELDRSETARMLLELEDPAPAGVQDDSGQSAIVWMINKMPPVAKTALDQFHIMDRANRKQYYRLDWLQPRKPGDDRAVFPQTALQVAVACRRFEILVHTSFLKLISTKWRRFGRLGAVFNLTVNICFILLWTLQGILIEYDQRHEYILPDQWYRILLFVLALLATGWQIKDELLEYFNSKKAHKQWKKWREKELERDLEYCHPRWPEEEQYIRGEIEALDQQNPQYFNDFWNIFDWVCYAMLLVVVITHLVDVFYHTNFIARLHIRIMAITIIIIWLRLMKNARAFSTLGPFIVIISQMSGDVIKFIFLYLEFYIPYVCAFWMLFGGDKVPEAYQGLPQAANHTVTVTGLQDVNALLFSLFRLTLVDDYDYDGMKSVDSIMADILVGTWLALSAVLMLNLFIALMSDTFQRVFDNAKANAVMQKAITILSIEEGLGKKRKEKFREYIHTTCAPLAEFYDDDAAGPETEDLKKVTIQIKEQLDELQEQIELGRTKKNNRGQRNNSEDLDELMSQLREDRLEENHKRDGLGDGTGDEEGKRRLKKSSSGNTVTVDKFESEVDCIRDEIQTLRDQQDTMMDRFSADMSTMKALLQQVASMVGNGAPPPAVHPLQDQPLNNIAVGILSPSEISVGPAPSVTAHSTRGLASPPEHQGRRREQTAFDAGSLDGVDDIPGYTPRQKKAALKHRSSYMGLVSQEPAPLDTDEEWDRSEEKRKRDINMLREQFTRASMTQQGGHGANLLESSAVIEVAGSHDSEPSIAPIVEVSDPPVSIGGPNRGEPSDRTSEV